MNPNKAIENIARADDLQDLLEHIAWERTVLPELIKYKDTYHNLLVKSVLGQSVVDQHTGQVISKEMLAGRVEGIEWITRFLTNVLKRGEQATASMQDFNVQ